MDNPPVLCSHAINPHDPLTKALASPLQQQRQRR
jgi:hypothetical protein